jgi:hypothetical protein
VIQNRRKKKFIIDKERYSDDHPEIEKLFDLFLTNFEYDPITIIDPNFITQAGYSWGGHNSWRNGSHSKNKARHNANTSYDIWDDYDDYGDYDVLTDSKESSRVLSRPSWRKTNTIKAVKRYGVDLEKFPKIDGSTSDEDTANIILALRENGYQDITIRNFLTTNGYPASSLDDFEKTFQKEEDDELIPTSEIDLEEDSDSILMLLIAAKDEEDLFDTLEILVDSNIDDETIIKYIQKAGLDEEVFHKFKERKSQQHLV